MASDRSLENVLEGVLFFHSETGTEGGYWAFQDSLYIKKDVPGGYCKKCGLYLKNQAGALKIDRVIILDEDLWEEFQRTGKIKEKPTCLGGNHEEYIGDSWSYEGLHILDNGDYLRIYHPDDNKEIWFGSINLKEYDLFSEHASGMWIHADQIGVERDVWAEYFFKGYPATLVPARRD